MPTVADIMEELRSKNALEKKAAAAPAEPVVETEDTEMKKVAEDLYAGGRIFGRGAVDEILSKLAEGPAAPKGKAAPSQGNLAEAKASPWMKTVEKVKNLHGGSSAPSGTGPNVVAEAPGIKAKQDQTPNPPEKQS